MLLADLLLQVAMQGNVLLTSTKKKKKKGEIDVSSSLSLLLVGINYAREPDKE